METVIRNKKGFSLVELIIVIAIMVALVAVMAPSFIKYVTKSRDSVLQESAESVLEMIKSEYASEHLDVVSGNAKASIFIYADDDGNVKIAYDKSKLAYKDENGSDDLESICGEDTSKKCLSKKVYRIDVNENNQGQIFAMDVTEDTSIRTALLAGKIPA